VKTPIEELELNSDFNTNAKANTKAKAKLKEYIDRANSPSYIDLEDEAQDEHKELEPKLEMLG
jgi:hypothetical protein